MTISGGFGDTSAGGGFPDAFAGDQGTMLLNALKSLNFIAGVSGWQIQRNGNAEFNNLTIRGTFFGTTFIINSSGLFFYSAAPALGNLILSMAPLGGVDSFGNAYLAGFNTYGATFTSQMTNGAVFFSDPAFTVNPGRVGISSSGLGGQTVSLSSGNTLAGVPVGSLGITDGSVVGGVPSFSMNGDLTVAAGSAAGQIANFQNTTGGPSDANLLVEGTNAGDIMLGIRLLTDTFNRIRVLTSAIQFGNGAGAQDTQIYRDSAGNFGIDTILANISGSTEVWHSLGTLAGATVNKGRYRLLPDGEVKFEISVTFGGSTAVPITWSNTLPAAYRVPGTADVRFPMDQTNGAGGTARTFIGSAGGGSPGSVQLAALANVIGSYDCYDSYSLL